MSVQELEQELKRLENSLLSGASLTDSAPLNSDQLNDIKVLMRIDAEEIAQNDAWTQSLVTKLASTSEGVDQPHTFLDIGGESKITRVKGSAVSMITATGKSIPYTKAADMESYLNTHYELIVTKPLMDKIDIDDTGVTQEAWSARIDQVQQASFETTAGITSDINSGSLYLDQNNLISNEKYDGMSTSQALAEGKIEYKSSLASGTAASTKGEGSAGDGGGGAGGDEGGGGGSGECCIFNEYEGGGCGPCGGK